MAPSPACTDPFIVPSCKQVTVALMQYDSARFVLGVAVFHEA